MPARFAVAGSVLERIVSRGRIPSGPSSQAILISSKRARARQSRICGFGTVRPKRRRANRWHAAPGRNLLRGSIGHPPPARPSSSSLSFSYFPTYVLLRASLVAARRDLIRSFALTFTSVFQRESPVIASLAVSLVLLGPDREGIGR